MYTTRIFQESVQQGGMGGYVWLALAIFFLMVFLGWLASSKGWLKKEEEPVMTDHGHDSHEHAESDPSMHETGHQHLESAHGTSLSVEDEILVEGNAPIKLSGAARAEAVSAPAIEPEAAPALVETESEAVADMVAAYEPPAAEAQVAPASAAGTTAPDDLTVLEGIGPKVASVLAGIGITTFDGLAKAEYATVKAALDAAGYKYMDPSGWFDQAVLAARGDKDGLMKLQAVMKGGRKAA